MDLGASTPPAPRSASDELGHAAAGTKAGKGKRVLARRSGLRPDERSPAPGQRPARGIEWGAGVTGEEADAVLARVPAEVKATVINQLAQLADLDEDALIELYDWVRTVRANLAGKGVKYADALYSFGAVAAACSMTIGAGE